ncbi:DUF4419 domain-containing protein [Flavobacterium sp. UBA6031]|uniref:DUF4419 domain-containing protein n=1 Tax=Flavobacterium sp. UBA6031 TaxID=1946551 RepID=UPI0025BDCEEE|nr:DUF4419 domain-containing protein [Flavobacterium sp. UBA6031]
MKRLAQIFLALTLISSCGHKQDKIKSTTLLTTDFEKPKGVSFNVNDVELADSMLKIDTAKRVFESKIGKQILFFPEEQANFGLVYCPNNGLIQTIQECYDNHRPLILTPDIIWLAICQAVSIHINENYDSLKNIIFTVNKPDKIIIRNDSLEYSAKQWKSLINSFSNETRKYTNDDFYSFFVSEFSTTTPIEKTAYQITLLESYKKAFEYVGETGCGIPSILITGKREDWQSILNKLDMLDKIGLSAWAKNLKPIIVEFIKASEGKQNLEFWKNIYKNASEYNAFYISGWIIKFFPYIKELESKGVYDPKIDKTRMGETLIHNKFIDGDNYLLSTLSTDNFPSGIAKIPVTWNNEFKGTTKKIEVFAGFFAIKQYPDKSLEPLISWAICDENAKRPNHKIAKNEDLNLKHKPEYWSPHFAENVTDSAIYNIKKFKSQSNSIQYIKKMIVDSLQSNNLFKNTEYINDTIQLEIFSNGKTGNITMTNSNDTKLLIYVTKLIKDLPEMWFPALAHPTDVLELGDDFPDKDNKMKIRANSIVKIGL